MKKCPSCGLFNPDSAVKCDCGYDLKEISPILNICTTEFNNISLENGINDKSLPIQSNWIYRKIKQYPIATFTMVLSFFYNLLIFISMIIFEEPDSQHSPLSDNILIIIVTIPILYFIQWLLVIFVMTKHPRDKLESRFLDHPVITIIFFILFIFELPYRIIEKLGGFFVLQIMSSFDVVLYWAFIFFLWWLLFSWISKKFYKTRKYNWNFYNKIINMIFHWIFPVYKYLIAILASLFIFSVLFILISLMLGYSGQDLFLN